MPPASGAAWRGDGVTAQPQPPPKRGRPPSLSVDAIAEAAARLAVPVGLAGVSMRALAAEIGVPVMTIYNYVPNRDALRRITADWVLRSVAVPPPEAGSWESRLKTLERDVRCALNRFPGVVLERGDSVEGERLAEGVLSILADAGFDPPAATLAFAALFTFMVGQIDADIEAGGPGGPAASAVSAAASATGLTSDDIFDFGFDALIEGLKAKLQRPKRRPRSFS